MSAQSHDLLPLSQQPCLCPAGLLFLWSASSAGLCSGSYEVCPLSADTPHWLCSQLLPLSRYLWFSLHRKDKSSELFHLPCAKTYSVTYICTQLESKGARFLLMGAVLIAQPCFHIEPCPFPLTWAQERVRQTPPFYLKKTKKKEKYSWNPASYPTVALLPFNPVSQTALRWVCCPASTLPFIFNPTHPVHGALSTAVTCSWLRASGHHSHCLTWLLAYFNTVDYFLLKCSWFPCLSRLLAILSPAPRPPLQPSTCGLCFKCRRPSEPSPKSALSSLRTLAGMERIWLRHLSWGSRPLTSNSLPDIASR